MDGAVPSGTCLGPTLVLMAQWLVEQRDLVERTMQFAIVRILQLKFCSGECRRAKVQVAMGEAVERTACISSRPGPPNRVILELRAVGVREQSEAVKLDGATLRALRRGGAQRGVAMRSWGAIRALGGRFVWRTGVVTIWGLFVLPSRPTRLPQLL